MRHETACGVPWLGAVALAMWDIGKPPRRRPRDATGRPQGRFSRRTSRVAALARCPASRCARLL